jgi:nicotinate (nicotinamide) nucleotide adenylyltransferase
MARDSIDTRGYSVTKGLFVPTHAGYTKDGLASSEQRVEMCRLTAALTDWTEVEAHDTEQAQWSLAVDTLAFIQSKYPTSHVFFVCGSDLVLRWNNPVWPPEQVIEILTKYGVVVASRPETIKLLLEQVPILRGHEDCIVGIDENPMGAVSSTLVRNLIGKGRQICGLVAPEVEKLIRAQRLYLNCASS